MTQVGTAKKGGCCGATIERIRKMVAWLLPQVDSHSGVG